MILLFRLIFFSIFFEPSIFSDSRSSTGQQQHASLQNSADSRQNYSEVIARFGGEHSGLSGAGPVAAPPVAESPSELAAAVDLLDLSQQDSLGFDSSFDRECFQLDNFFNLKKKTGVI